MKEKIINFINFLNKNFPELKQFSLGLALNENPYGINEFTHSENGYAYQKGKEIENEIEKFYKEKTIDIVHGFIEFAVEIKILEKNPKLPEQISIVIKKIEPNTKIIAKAFFRIF